MDGTYFLDFVTCQVTAGELVLISFALAFLYKYGQRLIEHTLGFPGMANRILSVKCFGLQQTPRFLWVAVSWLQSRRWNGEHIFGEKEVE